jgi:peptidoglycan hydrolase-like protein with peptidoglycan-binding domain
MRSWDLCLVIVFLWAVAPPTASLRGSAVVHAAQSGPQAPNAPMPTSEFIKSLQRELKRAGYDPGVADGKMGPATQRALREFQAAHGLYPTGTPDIPTLTRLLADSLPQ